MQYIAANAMSDVRAMFVEMRKREEDDACFHELMGFDMGKYLVTNTRYSYVNYNHT